MRQPTVAGQFYPLAPRSLKKELGRCFRGLELSETPVKGVIVPHAGYVYSGEVAANSYARLPKAETFVIFGPNHTGYGSPVALSCDDWSTPIGDIATDFELCKKLAGSIVDMDEVAHRYEHSIEVQIPFLQYRFGDDFKILPICLGMQDMDTAVEVGREVAKAAKELGRDVVFIASSDFTHYEPQEEAQGKDETLIEAILEMNIEEFYKRIVELNASACGYGPIAAMLAASKEMGATSAKLLKYATSGDVSGDYSAVVGYASIVVD
ncbi:AmmeMemoRadiSam system protein B [Methanohalophilus levihalophilus]|uniref:MEMO1 family protein n=1 Tax=Methanohalophilus levihalophilus TaxID=1431282 RepID=UPI001AE917B9|nr:MEMO1 family protein [Methanohalophilus levihalophilus]MBP2031145.1 AmmeMemoRadiSam system protein B [Methanohalophilus levihalophilus]